MKEEINDMAKQSMALSFKNATIDYSKDLITEKPSKDVINFYKLSDILKQWDNIEGNNIAFKKDDEIASNDDTDDTDGEDE